MVYSRGTTQDRTSYRPATRPSAGSIGQSGTETRSQRRLFLVVAVLGLAAYLLGFSPVVHGGGADGWSVRFASLAALGAGFALLPRQEPHELAVAALAAMGFLDALSSSVLGTDRGWPLIVMAVLNSAQATAAVAALLRRRAGTGAGYAGYEAYVDYYNQLARYYSAQAPSAPMPSPQSAQSSADAQRSAEHPASAPGQPLADERLAAPDPVGAMSQQSSSANPAGAGRTMHGGSAWSPAEYGQPVPSDSPVPHGPFAIHTGLPSAASSCAPAGAAEEDTQRTWPPSAAP
nr:DUF5336 domain-containing protein [Mycobacterium sp. 4858]